MSLPIEDLTPRQIVAELDKYIVGQDQAKRAVAIALRNRQRRQKLPADQRGDVMPNNILMIGPTGVGKTEIARRLATIARAPFVKVEATKFTEVGYVGRDVESMIRELVASAVRLVEAEKVEEVQEMARNAALDHLANILTLELHGPMDSPGRVSMFDNPMFARASEMFGASLPPELEQIELEKAEEGEGPSEEERREAYQEAWQRIRQEIADGKHNQHVVSVEVEEQASPFMQVFTPGGMEEMGFDTSGLNNPFGGPKRMTRKARVEDAIRILTEAEAHKHIDTAGVHREAIERAEQTGIIFLDEIDKIAGKEGGSGPDVSREGVQRDLLPVIEGSTVPSKYGSIRTDHILFIAAGAFHISKPSDLIPELQGRLPIRVQLHNLNQKDFQRILKEPRNALTNQYTRLLAVDGVDLEFTSDAIEELARLANDVNEKVENIGARRLHTLLERLLEDLMFRAPEDASGKVVVDSDFVKQRLSPVVNDAIQSQCIL